MKDELLVECDCGQEILLITDDNDCMFFLAMFERNYTRSWRNRLRLIWRIIRHGKPYADQMCFTDDKAKEIVKFLTERLKARK